MSAVAKITACRYRMENFTPCEICHPVIIEIDQIRQYDNVIARIGALEVCYAPADGYWVQGDVSAFKGQTIHIFRKDRAETHQIKVE
jgi:hypothetical protein